MICQRQLERSHVTAIRMLRQLERSPARGSAGQSPISSFSLAQDLCIARHLGLWRLRLGMGFFVDEDGQRQPEAIHVVAYAYLVAEVEQLG